MDEYGSSAGIARNASESAYPGLWRGLVAMYSPSAALSGSMLVDFARGNNGTLVGARKAVGKGETCISFPTTTTYVSIPDKELLKSVEKFSYVSRFCLIGTGNQSMFSMLAPGGYSSDILIAYYAGTLLFQVNNGADGSATCSYTVGNWTHLAMVFDGTQTGNAARLKVFINGIQSTLTFGGYTVPSVTSSSSANLNLGTYNIDWWINAGFMGDTMLYRRPLSPTEIMQSFKGASPLVPLNRPYFNSPTAPPPAGNTTNFFRFFR
jgi:hypothetical protein